MRAMAYDGPGHRRFVIARTDGAHIVDVRVRIAPAELRDPFLRQLR